MATDKRQSRTNGNVPQHGSRRPTLTPSQRQCPHSYRFRTATDSYKGLFTAHELNKSVPKVFYFPSILGQVKLPVVMLQAVLSALSLLLHI